MKDLSKIISDYPRPLFVRNSFLNLNGEWNFYVDDKRIYEHDQRFIEFPKDCLKINVPYCYQCELSGINDKTHYDTIYYQKEISFDYKENERVLFHIDAADYKTKLYVNGKFVGEHLGGYTSFCFDITDYLIEKKGNVVIRCDDSYSIHQPRGKQKWKDKPFECFYQEVNGIWKSVWAEIVRSTYITFFQFIPNKNNSVDVSILLNNFSFEGEIEINFLFLDKLVAQKLVRFGNEKLVTNVPLNEIHFWDTENPNLYSVKLKLIKNGEVIDEVSSYFGYRFIETENGKVLLNGKPLFMKLILEQGYYPKGIYTFENNAEMIKEIELIKNSGFNGLRVHQKVEDDRFYYLCDQVGLITWSEMPSGYDFDDELKENILREWQEILVQHINHPSILVWTPFNESWGIPGIRTSKEQQDFLVQIYDFTKRFDPTRLVISNDGWLHCKTDLVTFHNYIQDDEKLRYYTENILEICKNNTCINDAIAKFTPFANGFKYEGQPILLDEFCGIGFNVETVQNGWGYGDSVKDKDGLIDRYRRLIKCASTAPNIAGWCVTQLTDVYQEVNGLFTFNRQPKFDIKTLEEINKNNV
ncbi:MAG: glycoside hydrolase family 2 [Bacilli bacterium]|nr:glycoside hydrolase family 2 [Bacilli bacterium]